jgi:uncharacterized protein YprB with RNaseH-like and TPR domain
MYLLYLDIETTGINHCKNDILEISYLLEDYLEDRVLLFRTRRAKIENSLNIDSAAMEINKFDNFTSGTDIREIMKCLVVDIQKYSDIIPVTWNGHLDIPFIYKAMDRIGKNLFDYIDYHFFDGSAYYQGKNVKAGEKRKYSLESVYKKNIGGNITEFHNSRNDVLALREITHYIFSK